ncbi:MAG: complex I NDUFA9 subunit family protein [Phycisphaeraceae bacterium]|nr:complex I NDUFA9 subunit family protein [Phycisphaeraceae bacterium]
MATQPAVAVLGASGFVGRYVVRELLSRGYPVRALVRSRGSAREALPVRDDRLTLVEGDALADGVADRLVAGCGAAINLIGIIREGPRGQTFQRMHTAIPEAVVRACSAAGVRRLVHMSALGVGADSRSAYARTKWDGEQVVRRSGLMWTIFRPSLIHGPDGEFIQMMHDLMSGQTAPWYFIPYFTRSQRDTSVPAGSVSQVSASVQPVAVQDVAAAFCAALDTPQSVGEVYNLVGPDVMDWPELIEFLRDTLPGTNHRLVPWGIPGDAAAAGAMVAEKLGLGSLLPFNHGQAVMAMNDSTSESAKVKTDLGLTMRPFHETVQAYASQVE